MKTKKYIVQQMSYDVFRFSLYGFVTVVAFCVVFARPEAVKHVFVQANAYNRFVPLSIEAAVRQNQNNAAAPIKDPAVQQIIQDSFSASKLHVETEKVIDSTYAWLNDETAKPDFVVDFSPNIDTLAQELSTYGMSRLRALPICSVDMQVTDPFTASCRPQSFDYVAEQKSLEDAIRANNGIIPKTTFTVDDLPKTADGRTLVEQYAYVPQLFRAILYAPYVLLGVTIMSAVVAIRLDRKKRIATQRIGKSVIGATVFLILSPLFYVYVLPYFVPALSVDAAAGGGGVVLGDVITILTKQFTNQLIMVGLLCMVIGVMILVLERVTRPASRYVRVEKKAGLTSSEASRAKRGKIVVTAADVPIQTSEGKRSRYTQRTNKRYRQLAKKEF